MKKIYLLLLLFKLVCPQFVISNNITDTLKINLNDSSKLILSTINDTTGINSNKMIIQIIKDRDDLEYWVNIASIISIIVAVISIFIIIFQFKKQIKEQIRMQRAEYVYRLEDKYDNICEYRSQHPNIIETAKKWKSKNYSDLKNEEKRYYHYAEMVIGFIEIAIYMRYKDKSLSEDVFNKFITPMIIIEVNYNIALIKEFLDTAIMSSCSKEFIKEVIKLLEKYKIKENKIPDKILDHINWQELNKKCDVALHVQ